MDWLTQALTVMWDALAADLLSPLNVFSALDLRAPDWYSSLLWKLAAPFVAASLHAQQRLHRSRRR